jgi:hypothetical protein
MAKPTILISIDTSAETEAESFGRAFIQSLCDEDKRLVPEWVSTSERYKDPFLGIDDFLTHWWAIPVKTTVDGQSRPDSFDGPFWKRKSSLASRGMVNHGITDLWYHKHPSGLWFECRWAKDVDFKHLFDAWVQLSHPEIGMLHVFTEPELHWQDYAADTSFRVGSFGGPAKPGLPNMGWAMAYGKDYAAEVDVARIRAAGFAVDERDGVTIVRVTDSLNDVVDDFECFSRRRAELKALFRPDLFWIKQEPSEREIA